MKIFLEFGDTEISFKHTPKDSESREQLQTFLQSNLNLLKKFADTGFDPENLGKIYEKLKSITLDYSKDLKKLFEDCFKPEMQHEEDTKDNHIYLYANGHDIYNYMGRFGLTNYHIQAVLKLNGHLDYRKLVKAIRLTVDAQPVLGCRFVEADRPYWVRLENIDENLLCSFEESDNPEEAVQRFLDTPMDMDHDMMVKARLIHSENYDTLCIKMNHTCCDGSGLKEYIRLLSDIYSIVDQENGVFIPKACKRTRGDQDKIFEVMGIKEPELWVPESSPAAKNTWPFPWKQTPPDTFRIVIYKLSREIMEDMKRFSKARGVKINDLVLTAYYRAMSKMGEPVYDEPMEVAVTIDLRRLLPEQKTEALRNFSGSEIIKLPLIPDETFEETLFRVSSVMDEIKKSLPGLNSLIGLERLEKMPMGEIFSFNRSAAQRPLMYEDKCTAVLSNLGVVSHYLLKFGRIIVEDAFTIPPSSMAPGFILSSTTYNGVMTLTTGIYEGTIADEDLERLFGNISNELAEGCKL